MGDQLDIAGGAGGGFMHNMEAQYHKEARKREIERMKREFQDLKARNFKKGAGKDHTAGPKKEEGKEPDRNEAEGEPKGTPGHSKPNEVKAEGQVPKDSPL